MSFDSLWDFDQPRLSEDRFRNALKTAESEDPHGEEARLLRTQLARALALQGSFEQAAAELDSVAAPDSAPSPGMTPIVRAYLALERGRVLRSSGSPDEAVPLFLEALDVSRAAGLDHVAADAAHMMAIVGDAEAQITWAQRALEIATASTDPRARKWIGSIENNLGWTLHDERRYAEALVHFERGLAARIELGDAERIRIARWTVARALRSLERNEEALAIQWDLAAHGPEDGYVHEELAALLRALGHADEAEPHAARARELLSPPDATSAPA